MALSQTTIKFAKFQAEFTRAYMARDKRVQALYQSLLHELFIGVLCGSLPRP